MLFLLRLTFWLALVCLLLPGTADDNRRIVRSAEKTVADVRGFCQRNPDVCEDMRITMTSMLVRLKNGAELVQSWLAENTSQTGDSGAASSGGSGKAGARNGDPVQLVPKWQDSLGPSDKRVPWRGPSAL